MNPAQFHSTHPFTSARRGHIASPNCGAEPVARSYVTLILKGFQPRSASRTGMRDATAVEPLDVESLSTHLDSLAMRP
jgi:hypothetical protein